MKKFNLFGLKFTIDIKRKDKSEKELYSEEQFLKQKVFYLIIVMFTIVISSKIPIVFKNNNYVVGDFAKTDIYAPKTILFKDREAKNKIIENMISASEKEYIYSNDAAQLYLKAYEDFSKEILAIKNKNLNFFDYISFGKRMGKKIPSEIVNQLLELDDKKLNTLFLNTKLTLEEIYSEGVYKENDNIKISDKYKEILAKSDQITNSLVNTFLVPNYIYDRDKTRDSIEEKVSQIKDQYIEIKSGTLIARTGEILTQRKITILDKLGIYTYKTSIMILFLNIIYLILVSIIFYVVIVNFYSKEILHKNKYRAVFLLLTATFLIIRFLPENLFYLLPLDTSLFLLLFITTPRFSVFCFTILLSYMLPLINFDLEYFAIYSLAVIASGFLAKKITTRSAIIAAGIQLAVIKILLYTIFSYFSPAEGLGVAFNAVKIFTAGLFSGMFAIALLPYFERTFNILTIFKLIELADLSHPLLRKLSLEAPGTFQHSMMVAVLSENAVLKIGGNAVFTRVACYYHDIGKSKRPQFFVENQAGGENLHNKLSPFMSKMIILSHTKDGVEMAKKYQIPKEIRDIMYEHHGTTFLAYFYNKAKLLDESVTEEEFKYSGPKPQTRESAVIMLADSIEAAVRSIDIKNPITIEETIRKIVKNKIDHNQLSDANITFKEIEDIINSFVKTFSAIYHERIKYPGQKN